MIKKKLNIKYDRHEPTTLNELHTPSCGQSHTEYDGVKQHGLYASTLLLTLSQIPISFLEVVKKGTSVTLLCAIGYLAPYISWGKRSQRTFREVQTDRNLTIQSIQFTDSGSYRCGYTWPNWKTWKYGYIITVVVQGTPLTTIIFISFSIVM